MPKSKRMTDDERRAIERAIAARLDVHPDWIADQLVVGKAELVERARYDSPATSNLKPTAIYGLVNTLCAQPWTWRVGSQFVTMASSQDAYLNARRHLAKAHRLTHDWRAYGAMGGRPRRS